jgi:hypothetical protein
MLFLLGKGGDFIMFLVIDQPNGQLQKIKIKTFMLWDASQLIKLIDVNCNKYNKYLSSCKRYNK